MNYPFVEFYFHFRKNLLFLDIVSSNTDDHEYPKYIYHPSVWLKNTNDRFVGGI
jgi:hypothetical protein